MKSQQFFHLILLCFITSFSFAQSVTLTLENTTNILELEGLVVAPTFKLTHALGTFGELKISNDNLQLDHSGNEIIISPGAGDVILKSKVNVGNSNTNSISNPDIEGDIRYNISTEDFEGHTSDGWQSLTAGNEPPEPPIEMTIDTPQIGEYFQGGIVFWISPNKRHGKVVALNYVVDVPWSNVTSTCAGATSNTNGSMNTVMVINQANHISSAALICSKYEYGGYDDWYLFARDEAIQLRNNLSVVNAAMSTHLGVNISGEFWTSKETLCGLGLTYNLSSGITGQPLMSSLYKVIPIRSFSVEY